MRRLLNYAALIVLLTFAAQSRAAHVLIIASSNHNGQGPYTSEIQIPLQSAGHTVTVWQQSLQGWPVLDTLWNYDAVFFHGGERRRTGTIDTVLTAFAKQGGRLVVEGSNLGSFGGAYHEFEKYVTHADWQRTKQSSFTHQVVAPSHPIAAGLPTTFAASGYPAGALPDRVMPKYGGTLVIQFQSAVGTAAVSAVPRQAYLCGSIRRITTSGNARALLVQNLVSWVLQNPDDTGIIDMDYGLGTSVGQPCPVWVRLRNYGGNETGQVKLWASTDSSSWTAVDSSNFVLSGYQTTDLWFNWTPAFESRYYLRATLTAQGADSYPSNNAAAMLVTTFDEAVHPKLFFTAAEIPTLQARAASTHLGFYQQLNTAVLIDFNYVPLPPERWEEVSYANMGRMITLAAMKAVLTPTPTYINNAKNKAMALCRYEQWEPGANQNMDIYSGRAFFALALAYDWLYPHWTKAQRDTVRIKLRTQMERMAAAEPRWIWWTDAYMHNHNINCMSYLGSACYALYEEEPQAQIWEQMAIDNLQNVLALYGPVTDGSWYEAMNYWGFISWTMLPHLWLMREQRNINYFQTPWVQSMAKYRVYGSHPIVTQVPMINEAQADEWYGPDDQLALLAREYRDGHAQWMRQQVINRIGYSLDGPFDFFFYDPTVPQVVPTDLSWIATDQDTYFGRSAWADTNATYVTLKCGLVCGRNAYERYWGQGPVGAWEPSHFLPEQNAFTLSYGRDYIVQAAGLQSPFHRTYNTTTILVNGQGQIGDSTKGIWPLPIDELSMNPHLADTFMLKNVDYVVGDATTSYPTVLGLTKFKRHILYVRPDLVVVLDDLKATNPSTFSFLIRHPSQIYTYTGNSVFIDGLRTDSDMFMLSPPDRTHQYYYSNYYESSIGGWGMYINNATPDTAVKFVNAFYPRRPNQAQAQLLYSSSGLTVLRVGDNSGFEATCAITHGHNGYITVDSLTTNASLAVVVRNDVTGAIRMGAARQCTFVDWGTPTRRLFESPVPVDADWSIRGDTLEINGSLGEWAVLYAPNISFVWLNGQGEPFYQNGEYVEIGNLANVPTGRVVDLRLAYTDGDFKLYWTAPVFYVQGIPTFPDYYDIYSCDSADGNFRLMDTVPGNVQSFSFGEPSEEMQFYHVVSRLRATQAAPIIVPREVMANGEASVDAREAGGRVTKK